MNKLVLCPQSVGNINAYIQAVNSLPVLSKQEELDYAVSLQETADVNAAQQLVMSNLRFVVKIARGYQGYGLNLPDLIQEGNVGLMKAVKRFNPEVGVRLVSFAVHWIRSEIHDFVIRNWRIVKIATTKPQRKLFFNLRSSKKRLGWLNQNEVNEVATDLGVTAKDVLEMERRMSNYDMEFDAPDNADEESTFSPSAYLPSPEASPEQQLEKACFEQHQHGLLQKALKGLDERSQKIIKTRWLNDKKATLHDLAEEFNVSAERIRQLEKQALGKLKTTIAA
jgi:RNA polymerase sigma-32 factor